MRAILDAVWSWMITEGVKVVFGIIVFIILCKVINFVCNRVHKRLEKKNVDKTVSDTLLNFCRKGLKIILFVCFLALIGIETSAISAAIASLGLAIGLALQGSLSNFAGGIIILIMRPFKLGDYVEAAGKEGTVEKIELFYTHLVTTDNRVIMVPNSSVANGNIINYSAKHNRRLDMTFSIGYDADYEKAKELVAKCIADTGLALDEPAKPFINIAKHDESAIQLTARIWVNSANYWNLNWILMESVKKAFDENGINIPYPQMDVHIKNDAK